jgi:hypothetical protein
LVDTRAEPEIIGVDDQIALWIHGPFPIQLGDTSSFAARVRASCSQSWA